MDLCREKGVISFESGGVKMLFGPPVTKAAKVDSDPRAVKRDHYANLLGRNHTNEELDQLP